MPLLYTYSSNLEYSRLFKYREIRIISWFVEICGGGIYISYHNIITYNIYLKIEKIIMKYYNGVIMEIL